MRNHTSGGRSWEISLIPGNFNKYDIDNTFWKTTLCGFYTRLFYFLENYTTRISDCTDYRIQCICIFPEGTPRGAYQNVVWTPVCISWRTKLRRRSTRLTGDGRSCHTRVVPRIYIRNGDGATIFVRSDAAQRFFFSFYNAVRICTSTYDRTTCIYLFNFFFSLFSIEIYFTLGFYFYFILLFESVRVII